MAPTTSWPDCQRFATTVSAAGGALPAPLRHLLSSYEVLSTPAATAAPENGIMDHVLAGTLTAEKLAELAPVAASAAATADYLRGLARSCEHTLVGQWHRQMKNGAADQILNSLRKNFDTHAAAIGVARSLFTAESTPEHVLASAEPKAIEAWQQLEGHLKVITRIAAIASQFGCRPTAQFPQITEYSLAENARVDDRALMCCDGSLIADSWLFGRPDPAGHRSSPFFKTALRLRTIAEAQERYNEFAAIEFDKVHSGPRGGWIDPATGQMYEDPAPENPFRQKVST